MPFQISGADMEPAPQTLTVTWYAGNGSQDDPIIGHGTTVIIPGKYAGHYVYAKFIATASHVTTSEDWTGPEKVKFGVLPAQTAPTAAGRPITGSPFRAAFTPLAMSGVHYVYQWYSAASSTAKPVAIAHATSSSYVPAASLKGRILSVRVTASKVGYTSESTYSVGTVPLLSPTALQVHPAPSHAASISVLPHTLL